MRLNCQRLEEKPHKAETHPCELGPAQRELICLSSKEGSISDVTSEGSLPLVATHLWIKNQTRKQILIKARGTRKTNSQNHIRTQWE